MRIFLTGMMGCGKSFWAPKIAALGGFDSVDLDEYIEEKMQQSVSDIFKNMGEPFFRKTESECLTEIIQRHIHCIVATGGGTPCFHNNFELMKASGKVVYLRYELHTLVERIAAFKEQRPLLNQLADADVLEVLTEIYEPRKKYYENSDIIIDMNQCDEANFAKKFIQKYV